MSETTTETAHVADSPNLASLLIDDIMGGGLEPEAEAPTETPAPAETPAVAVVATPEATPATPNPTAEAPEVPVWQGQEEAGRAFAEKQREIKELREALAAAERERAYQAGLAAGRAPQEAAKEAPKPAEDPEPNSDDFHDDAAYFAALRAWDRRQAAKEALATVLPEVQALKAATAKQEQEAADRNWDLSMERAKNAAGADWPAVAAFANRQRQASPGWGVDLDGSADPGAFALKAFNEARIALGLPAAGAGGPTTPAAPAAAPAPSPAAPAAKPAAVDLATLLADPATHEAALRLIATQRAAAGHVPHVPTHGPRGAGTGPGAHGAPDDVAAVTVDAVKSAKPEQLNAMSRTTFGSFIVGDDG